MNVVSKETVQDVLKQHKEWLDGLPQGKQANLLYYYRMYLFASHLEAYRQENGGDLKCIL